MSDLLIVIVLALASVYVVFQLVRVWRQDQDQKRNPDFYRVPSQALFDWLEGRVDRIERELEVTPADRPRPRT